jgi:hypothetical protein
MMRSRSSSTLSKFISFPHPLIFGCFRILGRLVDGEVESNREREGRVCVYICVCSGVKEYVFSGRREKDRGIEFVCLCL